MVDVSDVLVIVALASVVLIVRLFLVVTCGTSRCGSSVLVAEVLVVLVVLMGCGSKIDLWHWQLW